MPGQKLDQYRGRLDAAQIAAGMNAARGNAASLLADAELLLKGERYPRATALAILSIEEVGKLAILRQAATSKDDATLRRVWKDCGDADRGSGKRQDGCDQP